jgi:hypothetical protein
MIKQDTRFKPTRSSPASAVRKKRKYVKRNRALELGTVICLRLQPNALEQLDLWIIKQDDFPSRPEAVRRMIEKVLGKPKSSSRRRS